MAGAIVQVVEAVSQIGNRQFKVLGLRAELRRSRSAILRDSNCDQRPKHQSLRSLCKLGSATRLISADSEGARKVSTSRISRQLTDSDEMSRAGISSWSGCASDCRVGAPPQGIGLVTAATERHERWEMDPVLMAAVAAFGGGRSRSRRASPPIGV